MEAQFVKVVLPEGYDFGEPVVRQVKVASSGLRGNDLKAFIKRAGHQFADQFHRVYDQLKPGDVPVHLFAVGATEDYGPNRNGDGFKRANCRKYHDTFVKYSRWYRNHANKDPEKSHGYVKLSAFNERMKRIELLAVLNGTKEAASRNGGLVADEEMEKLGRGEDIPVSMACFPPGTPVGLADGTETAIDKVALGERVVTHHGNVGEVEALMSRDYDGDLVRFRASGLPDDVVSTSNHRIWVRPSLQGKSPKCPVCSRQFKSLRAHLRQMADSQHRAAYLDYGRYAEGWVRAEHLTIGDYVRTPFFTDVAEPGDETYAELLGFYLSEGNTFHYKKSPSQDGVDFSFAKTERAYADRVVLLLSAMGYNRVHVYERKNNVRLVRVTSPELAARLEADAGRYSWGKALATRFMSWLPSVQMKLFAAFMCGDGHFHRTHRSLIATTVSRRLAFQLATICWRNGIPARIGAHSPKAKRRVYTVHVQESHVADVPCDKVPADFKYHHATRRLDHLKNQQGGTWTGTCSTTLAYVERGFVYRRLVRVSTEYYRGPVHNISVSVDSSYTVNGVAVSNCKVPFDVCSGCGNKARNRDEYCRGVDEGGLCKSGGLRNRIATVTGDDENPILHADNPDPLFFDISKVVRPADRIAYVLGQMKAAGGVTLGGAALAEEWGVTAPPDLEATGAAAEMMKIARRLAELEEEFERSPADRWRLAFADQPRTTWSDHGGRMGEALQALARVKVAMPLEGFLEMVTRDPVKVARAADSVRPHLPGIYGRLMKTGEAARLVETNPFLPAQALAPLAVRRWAEKRASGYSLERRTADLRVMRASITRGLPEARTIVLEKAAGAAAEVAKQYAMYKLAFAHAVRESDDDLNLTLKLLVVQNYL